MPYSASLDETEETGRASSSIFSATSQSNTATIASTQNQILEGTTITLNTDIFEYSKRQQGNDIKSLFIWYIIKTNYEWPKTPRRPIFKKQVV